MKTILTITLLFCFVSQVNADTRVKVFIVDQSESNGITITVSYDGRNMEGTFDDLPLAGLEVEGTGRFSEVFGGDIIPAGQEMVNLMEDAIKLGEKIHKEKDYGTTLILSRNDVFACPPLRDGSHEDKRIGIIAIHLLMISPEKADIRYDFGGMRTISPDQLKWIVSTYQMLRSKAITKHVTMTRKYKLDQ